MGSSADQRGGERCAPEAVGEVVFRTGVEVNQGFKGSVGQVRVWRWLGRKLSGHGVKSRYRVVGFRHCEGHE